MASLSDFDGQIAAIARVQGISLATFYLADFEHCLVELIDPSSLEGLGPWFMTPESNE